MVPDFTHLAILDQASRILAQAKSIDEVKAIRDKAEATRNYVKAAKLGLELQNRAAEIKLCAERKAGGLLRSLKLRGGDRRSKWRDATLKLRDLKISRDQSKRWQHISSVSDIEFYRYLRETTEQGREITSAGLLRIAAKRQPASRTARSSSSQPPSAGSAKDHTVEEMLEDLVNHCQLLGDILRPIYEEIGLELKRGEKRAVGHLIAEMTTLIAQLKKTWEPIKN